VARTADDAILDAAINGNRILAMKLYREQYRVSLAEAKKFIEGL
jgi:ribosomal protein L7/L12